MKPLLPFVLLLILVFAFPIAKASELPIADSTQKLDLKLLEFIGLTLQGDTLAKHLRCGVKAAVSHETRSFSNGPTSTDTLTVNYQDDRDYGGISMKSFFSLDSEYTRSIVNSEFAGTVEQIELFAGDPEYHYFIFQHDGRGHIVWMMMGDQYTTAPCQLRE